MVLAGGYLPAESGILRAMHRVRYALALDLVERLVAVEGVCALVLSDEESLRQQAAALGARVRETPSGAAFDWLQEVQAAVRAERRDAQEAVLVLGGSAAPFLQNEQVEKVRWQVQAGEVWQNNRLSPDLVLFRPAEALERVRSCATDNEFGHALERQAGLSVRYFSRELAYAFDVDTPFDAVLAAENGQAGERLREAVKAIEHRVPVREVVELLRGDDYPDVAMIGRVHPVAAEQFSQAVGMRLRLYSEERGMKALGRIARGEVRSLVGAYAEAVGWTAFFAELSRTAQAAFMDTRVLFAHRQAMLRRVAEKGGQNKCSVIDFELSEADRFFADLGLYEEIADPWLRELVRAAVDAPIPILMGGQSLVSGGLGLLQAMILPE